MSMSDDTIAVGTVILLAVALGLYLFSRHQARKQEEWREQKLRSIDAKKAAIAAKKRGQDPDNQSSAD